MKILQRTLIVVFTLSFLNCSIYSMELDKNDIKKLNVSVDCFKRQAFEQFKICFKNFFDQKPQLAQNFKDVEGSFKTFLVQPFEEELYYSLLSLSEKYSEWDKNTDLGKQQRVDVIKDIKQRWTNSFLKGIEKSHFNQLRTDQNFSKFLDFVDVLIEAELNEFVKHSREYLNGAKHGYVLGKNGAKIVALGLWAYLIGSVFYPSMKNLSDPEYKYPAMRSLGLGLIIGVIYQKTLGLKSLIPSPTEIWSSTKWFLGWNKDKQK